MCQYLLTCEALNSPVSGHGQLVEGGAPKPSLYTPIFPIYPYIPYICPLGTPQDARDRSFSSMPMTHQILEQRSAARPCCGDHDKS